MIIKYNLSSLSVNASLVSSVSFVIIWGNLWERVSKTWTVILLSCENFKKSLITEKLAWKKSVYFLSCSGLLAKMNTMWHSGFGDTPLGIYLSKNIHILKSYSCDFQICNKAASVWWACLYIVITW